MQTGRQIQISPFYVILYLKILFQIKLNPTIAIGPIFNILILVQVIDTGFICSVPYIRLYDRPIAMCVVDNMFLHFIRKMQ